MKFPEKSRFFVLFIVRGGVGLREWVGIFFPIGAEVSLASTPHNILFKPPASLPHNYCRNNGQQ